MTDKETLKLALDDLMVEYDMERTSFAKRVDEIFKQATPEQPSPVTSLQARALDKMAENARDLGLDYEPAPVQPVAWLYPEGLEALKSGKCWTAYGTKQDDNCNILVYLAAVAPKVEPVKTECDGFDSHPAAPVQEPEYWNVIDPAGNIVASETDAIRGWARIAGSYKPTVEGLLGFHDQGWRVLPKPAPPAQPAPVFSFQMQLKPGWGNQYPKAMAIGQPDIESLFGKIGDIVTFYATPPEAQPAPVRPVAWLVEFENGEQELHFDEQSVGETNTPLYTTPPAQPAQGETK